MSVLSESLSLKAFRDGNQKVGYTKEYAELGYKAELQKTGSSPVQTSFQGIRNLYEPRWVWRIYDYKDDTISLIARLYETRFLKLVTQGGMKSDIDSPFEKLEPFELGIDAAVKYVWIQRQKGNYPKSVTEAKVKKEIDYFGPDNHNKDKYEFKELGYKAYYQSDNVQPYWAITEYRPHSGTDMELGMLWFDGDLEYSKLGSPNWETYKGFGTDLEKAARYIWLQRQEPLPQPVTETVVKATSKTIVMKDLGYKVVELSYGGCNIIDLNAPEGERLVGYLTSYGKLNYDSNPTKDRIGSWEHLVDFTQSPKNAARFIWLQRQQPLNESKQSIRIPTGIRGMWAVNTAPHSNVNTYEFHKKDAIIEPSVAKVTFGRPTEVARLVFGPSFGTPQLYLRGYRSENANRFMNSDGTPDVKKVASYVWLKTQKPLDKIKQLVSEIEIEDTEPQSRWYYPELGHMSVEKREYPVSATWEFRSNVGDGQLAILRKQEKYNVVPIVWEYRLKFIGNTDEPEDAKQFVMDNGEINIDSLAKYVWLKTQHPLNEDHYQPMHTRVFAKRRVYKEIDGWFTTQHDDNNISIYAPNKRFPDYGYLMGHIQKVGMIKNSRTTLKYIDSEGQEKVIPWEFNDLKNAVRFVYLNSQKPVY